MYMYGWVFGYSAETITTLLIGYTPIQNKRFKRSKKKSSTHPVGFLGGSVLKRHAGDAGDTEDTGSSLTSDLGRSPGVGHGNPL